MSPARSPEEIRASIEANRMELGVAVEKLRAEVAEATDWRRKLRENNQQVLIGAVVAGFVVGGGIAAFGGMFRRRRERVLVARARCRRESPRRCARARPATRAPRALPRASRPAHRGSLTCWWNVKEPCDAREPSSSKPPFAPRGRAARTARACCRQVAVMMPEAEPDSGGCVGPVPGAAIAASRASVR